MRCSPAARCSAGDMALMASWAMGPIRIQRIPVAVAGISTAIAITAGAYHSCAVLRSGSVECWGYNGDGELGNGTR